MSLQQSQPAPVSRREAASELLLRRTVRGSLTEWARYKGLEPAEHHQLIIDEIEAFLEPGNLDDVLVLAAPPGSAKSTYVSVLTPAWYLSRWPQNSILAATHNDTFAERWGRRVRNDVALDSDILGIELAADATAAGRWALAQGGEYYGVGAGVGISGYRADLGIIDDLFGKRQDAWSETMRQSRWDWYVDDFSARLKPHAKRIIMNTRWHEDDVAGRVIAQIKAGILRGRIIELRAIAEADDPLGRELGEYLWDESGYGYGDFLRARQAEATPMMWSALYQQRPTPEEGVYFKAEWLRYYDTEPPLRELAIYGGSDYAVTSDGGDYTVHAIIGVDPEGRMFVLDVWRRQASSDVWVDVFCDLVKDYEPREWAEEKGQIEAGVGPWLLKQQRLREAYVVRTQFPTRGDKAVRAQSMRGRMAAGGLYLPRDEPWTEPLRAELLAFPAGKHDDQVDALGLIGQLLDKIAEGDRPRPNVPQPRDKYRRKDEEAEARVSWKTA